jgi:hypothetical protein
MEADFSGYATKAGLKCSDGLTITAEAFKHMDGMTVPLVWQHAHNSPDNVLGHAVLEARSDGVYAFGFFNDTAAGKNAKALVEHKDIKSLSIYANQIVKKSASVLHGMIREVSLVLSGANPGALIDFVRVAHSDDPSDVELLDDEAVIFTGLELEVAHADSAPADDETIQDILNSMTPKQQNVVGYLVQQAMMTGSSAEHSGLKPADKDDADDTSDDDTDNTDDKPDESKPDTDDVKHEEGTENMPRNVFDQTDKTKGDGPKHVLSHSDVKGIVQDAMKLGSMKEAVEAYAIAHGITNIEELFPDAKLLNNRPEFNQRRVEWVDGVIAATGKSPFSRVKTVTADITMDEARALGYVKGNLKKEEWFSVTTRKTGPTTVYKKQKLDRDDIIDITDFDVVAWMKAEMRMMLLEEIARAILVGDGRDVSDEDKIKDPMASADGDGIRSILNEHELFATTVNVNLLDTSSSYLELIESVLRARKFYKGTGMPTFYTTEAVATELLLIRDEDGSNRRLYNSLAEVANAMRVKEVVVVEAMEHEAYSDVVGIIVNLADYNIGADKGGEVNLFDDFDIDYNQYKYLIETRISGALTRIKSALVIKETAEANVLVAPTRPTFVASTGVVTIPTKTGVVYKNEDTDATLTAGAQAALDPGESLNVIAVPDTGYYFADNASDEWTFTRPSA